MTSRKSVIDELKLLAIVVVVGVHVVGVVIAVSYWLSMYQTVGI